MKSQQNIPANDFCIFIDARNIHDDETKGTTIAAIAWKVEAY